MPIAVLCAVLLVSGTSALAFETLWFHQASLGFGNGIWASSLVLSGFMAGTALGGWLAARLADRVRNGLRAYAVLELLVAASGLALVYLLPSAHRALTPFAASLANHLGMLDGLRLLLAFCMLLVPSTAIGATLPLLVRVGIEREANFGRLLGLLYGINTLGAVSGAIATETLSLPRLGVHGSGWFAATLDVAVAAVALVASRRGTADAQPAVTSTSGSVLSADTVPWLAAAFSCGFILLALEVVWLRVLLLFLNDTPLAFAMILALVLTGIALGSLLAAAWAKRAARPESGVAFLAYAAGAFGVGGYLLYPLVFRHVISAKQPALTVLGVAAPLVLPTCCASGALFALFGVGLQRKQPSHARAVGLLGLFNTSGAGLGSLFAAFVLLPRLGMEWSLFGLLAAYGLVGGALSMAVRPRKLALVAPALGFALCFACFPFGFIRDKYIQASARRWMLKGDNVQVREGRRATMLHVVHRINGAPRYDQVLTNAYSMTVNGFFGRRYMKLFVYLPAALHPQLRRALVVGYGIGNTTQALTEDPSVTRIDVADISRDMLEFSRGMQTRAKPHPLDDPRVHVSIEDGRFLLQSTEAQYDLITGEPPPPNLAGVVNLYTREYFELIRTRLAPGGMATYWLPTMNISAEAAKSIIAAFCAAFPDCSLWQGVPTNFVLMGTRDAKRPASLAAFSRAWRDTSRRRELESIGLELPSQLGALFIGDAPYLDRLTRGTKPLSDNWPERIQQPGRDEDRDALVASWRDTHRARERFASSAWIRSLWPVELRESTAAQFENQRLLDDLLQAKRSWARGTRVLHMVLRSTQLKFPVLLLMHSDPDIQRAMSQLTPLEREQPVWLPHRAAARLAARDWAGALELLNRTPDELLPIADVRDYLAYAVERMAAHTAR